MPTTNSPSSSTNKVIPVKSAPVSSPPPAPVVKPAKAPAPAQISITKPTAKPAAAVPATPKAVPKPAIVAPKAGFNLPKALKSNSAPAASTSSATKAKTTPAVNGTASNIMPHKSHFGIGLIAAAVVIALMGGGWLYVSGHLHTSGTKPAVTQPEDAALRDLDTKQQELDQDVKDANGALNDQAGDLTEN